MAQKKGRKQKLSKKDESQLNRIISIVAGAFLVFFLVFLLSYGKVTPLIQEPQIKFEDLTPMEQLELVKTEEQQSIDQTNYNRAMAFQDNSYCEQIDNAELASQCYSNAPENNQPEEPEISENEAMDKTYYNMAKSFEDSAYCESIKATQLKTECFSETKQ